MLNFKDELLKYQPILELEEIHNSLKPSQLKDLIDILEHIATDREQKTVQSQSKIKQNQETSSKMKNKTNQDTNQEITQEMRQEITQKMNESMNQEIKRSRKK